MSACNCRNRVNEQLSVYNTRIEVIYSVSDAGLGVPWPISTVQIEKGRGKPKAMGLFASFCPFCGASLRDAAKAEVQQMQPLDMSRVSNDFCRERAEAFRAWCHHPDREGGLQEALNQLDEACVLLHALASLPRASPGAA